MLSSISSKELSVHGTATDSFGLVGDVTASDAEVEGIETTIALLRVFSKEACDVAGRCSLAEGRNEVNGRDMRNALMYCARMFFQKEDEELVRRINSELSEMREEESDEEEESTLDAERSSESSEGTEETEETADTEEDHDAAKDEGEERVPDEADIRLAKAVTTIVSTWSLWEPTDPVHQMIKRAIDNTPVADDD